MKWIDLVVETSKFELRKGFRKEEVENINNLSASIIL